MTDRPIIILPVRRPSKRVRPGPTPNDHQARIDARQAEHDAADARIAALTSRAGR